MPLTIDGSSPAAHTSAPATNTCASFNPPDDSLLLVPWVGDSQGFDPGGNPAISSSPAQSWVLDNYDHSNSGSPVLDGQSAIWHAVVVGTAGATTVSVTNQASVSFDSMMAPLVVLGHDPVTPVGVTGGGRQSGGTTITQSFTASIDGGQGVLIVCDWNASDVTTWAAATGCTIISKGTNPSQISYAAVRRTAADEVAGVSTSLGLIGLVSGGIYHWSYAEVISLEAAAAARFRTVIVDGSNAANW
jgi:hypothetical protein